MNHMSDVRVTPKACETPHTTLVGQTVPVSYPFLGLSRTLFHSDFGP